MLSTMSRGVLSEQTPAASSRQGTGRTHAIHGDRERDATVSTRDGERE